MAQLLCHSSLEQHGGGTPLPCAHCTVLCFPLPKKGGEASIGDQHHSLCLPCCPQALTSSSWLCLQGLALPQDSSLGVTTIKHNEKSAPGRWRGQPQLWGAPLIPKGCGGSLWRALGKAPCCCEDTRSRGKGRWEKAVSRAQSPWHLPVPLAPHSARPRSTGDMPEHQGPGELCGQPGQAGTSPCGTFPWKRTCFSQGCLAGLQEERDIPAPSVGIRTALQKHGGQPSCYHSAGQTKAGRVSAAGNTAGDGHLQLLWALPGSLSHAAHRVDASCHSLPAGMRAVRDTITCASKAR